MLIFFCDTRDSPFPLNLQNLELLCELNKPLQAHFSLSLISSMNGGQLEWVKVLSENTGASIRGMHKMDASLKYLQSAF